MYKVLDNNERLFQIKFLTGTRKTVLINEKSCREVPDKECDGVLFELCCAISAIEAEGHIITSVVELCEDGSTPRVAFRNTKEYRAAKQVQDSVSVPTRIERIRTMDKFHLGVLLNDIRNESQKYPECHMAWIDWLNGQPEGTIIGKNF
jgi:hypothetical protein